MRRELRIYRLEGEYPVGVEIILSSAVGQEIVHLSLTSFEAVQLGESLTDAGATDI